MALKAAFPVSIGNKTDGAQQQSIRARPCAIGRNSRSIPHCGQRLYHDPHISGLQKRKVATDRQNSLGPATADRRHSFRQRAVQVTTLRLRQNLSAGISGDIQDVLRPADNHRP